MDDEIDDLATCALLMEADEVDRIKSLLPGYPTVVPAVESNEDCPICLDEFVLPQYLPCTHRVCHACLSELYKHANTTCPLCRIPMPPGPSILYKTAVFFDTIALRAPAPRNRALYCTTIHLCSMIIEMDCGMTAGALCILGVCYQYGRGVPLCLDKAHRHLSEAVDIIENTPESLDTEKVDALCKLASLLEDMCDYEKALALATRSLAISEIKKDNPQTVHPLTIIIAIYKAQGNFREALGIAREAVRICETVHGPDHTNTATALGFLAMVYEGLGQYHEALERAKRALIVDELTFGIGHHLTATSLTNLVIIHKRMGNLQEALTFAERVLKMYSDVHGPDHLYTAASLCELSLVHRDMGNCKDALQMMQRCLDIRKNSCGDNHPLVAVSISNVAIIHGELGDVESALPLLTDATQIYETVFGSEHPETANSLSNLAMACRDVGDVERALPLIQRARCIYMAVYGPSDDRTLHSIAEEGSMRQVMCGSNTAPGKRTNGNAQMSMKQRRNLEKKAIKAAKLAAKLAARKILQSAKHTTSKQKHT